MTLLLSLLQGIHGAPTKLFTPSRILLREKHGKEVTQHRAPGQFGLHLEEDHFTVEASELRRQLLFFLLLKMGDPPKACKTANF